MMKDEYTCALEKENLRLRLRVKELEDRVSEVTKIAVDGALARDAAMLEMICLGIVSKPVV